uniref:EF-hand calcium binding domain 14 n=1 Tax=Apteryx owenii TaxID=8824 RepID=A0A8B9PP05_APTOW
PASCGTAGWLSGAHMSGRRRRPSAKPGRHPHRARTASSLSQMQRSCSGDYLRCCKFCYPLCAFVILAACVVACVGLVWMQVALKEDLDAIKEKFRTMESNQKTSFQEIPKLNEDLLQKQKQLEQIETGELGLNKIWINITEINKQVSLLTSTVNHLKTNIKSASDLITLPLTVEKLQKTVANIGSTLTSVSHDVENMQTAIEEYKKSIETLQNDVVRKFTILLTARMLQQLSKLTCSGFTFQESQSLHAALEELNNTVVIYQKLNDIKLLNVDSAIGNLSQRVTLLENSLVAVNKLDKRENLSTSVVSIWCLWVSTQASTFRTVHIDSQVSKLREKLQLISALSSKSENERSVEASKNVINLFADLQNLFEKETGDADGKLSYEDLQKLLGSTLQELQSFKKFDTDGDEKYSLQELKLALGV